MTLLRTALAWRNKNAWPLARTRHSWWSRGYLLLRLLDFFSPPWLLRLLLPRALARSLCALLFWLLALPPLLAAAERLIP